jgi:hypothetical protein
VVAVLDVRLQLTAAVRRPGFIHQTLTTEPVVPKKKPVPVRIALRVIILPKDETIQVYVSNHPAGDNLTVFPDPTVLPIKDGVTANATRLASRLHHPGIPHMRWTELVRNLMWLVGPELFTVTMYVWTDRVDHA